MRILIFSCFYQKYNGARPQMLLDYFSSKGEARLVAADFCHDIKQYKIEDDNRVRYIHVPAYQGNMSLKRIWSHIVFAVKSVKLLSREDADLCYVCLPPNLAAYYLVKKAKKKGIAVIADIVDVWPQKQSKNRLYSALYKKWGSYREKTLIQTDWVVCECDYYRKKIAYNGSNISTIYLAKNMKNNDIKVLLDGVIKICYLGNIGNSYDFDSLAYICRHVKKECEVVIIGDGEKKTYLIDLLKKNNIKYSFYGYLYEEDKKEEILKNCTFGYNAFNDDIPVALSYKSMDYLMNGLPIINSTQQDLYELIDDYDAGLNFVRDNLDDVVRTIDNLSVLDINIMRRNALRLFRENFTETAFEASLDKVFREVIRTA